MEFTIRPALPSDDERVIQIAAEGDFDNCDSVYLSFIRATGQLLCATVDETAVAFAGMVPVADIAMVTDLFVAQAARGQGVGGRLLAELLAGRTQSMTFSAQHPAAQSAYRRAGMAPRCRMLYLSGSAIGGGPKLVPGGWIHGRDELVGYFVGRGAVITPNAVVLIGATGVEVLRLDAVNAIDECQQLLRAFEAGTNVKLYVPEMHPLAAWLLAQQFVITDHDLLFTTDAVALPATLAALHPGLA
ncbi:MAG: GNAT family N-acetyltransferase [Actinomycetia bacterium]|nr:GNAT family N-acetyltransferase [Actinomycetes bacterium]